MMKKNGWKYFLLVLAGIAAIYLLFRDRIPFGKNNTDFAVKQKTDITHIDLLKGKELLSLRKSGNSWTVNSEKEARKSAVLFMIKTLKEVKIKSPVSGDIFRSEVVERKVEPVRVVIYEKRRPVRSFYVYCTDSNPYGNIMKKNISSKPYIVYLPGNECNIGSYFITSELFWLPFSAFSLLPSRIESVEMENIADPQASFQIVRKAGSFSLRVNNADVTGWDSLRVRRYISYFTSVAFETWAPDMTDQEKRTIESSQPLCRIRVKPVEGEEIVLTIWERVKDSVKGERDTDRVWGEKNDGNGIFVMRFLDLDPVMKKKSYFFGG